MKTTTMMKTTITTAFLAVMLLFTCCAGKKAVTLEELPDPLRTMLTQHFPDNKLSYAIREDGNKYELVLSDGTELETDKRGNWREIKCSHGSAVPKGLLPPQIDSYVSAKHPEASVRKIEKKKKGYEIELSNGLEIKFNNDFVVIEYDR